MAKIKLLILDVDGVMTDGSLPYSPGGCQLKPFFVQDGGAIKRWRQTGGEVAIVSGRASEAVETRARDLGIALVRQGVADKLPAYEELRIAVGVADAAVSVMGDDLLDIPPMQRCGYAIAPANALPGVKRVAHYITRRAGGAGAVAEAVERLLRLNGLWSSAARPTGLHG